MGPIVSRLGASGQTPSSDTRPWVVLSPAIPQHAAGTRTEPPVSEPSATSASSLATATADPLEEPPGISAGSSGLTGVPYQGFVPSGSTASSCRLVFPTRRAPALRAPARHAASRSAGCALRSSAFDPAVVGTPSTSMMSLTARRTPEPCDCILVMKVDIGCACCRRLRPRSAGSAAREARAQALERHHRAFRAAANRWHQAELTRELVHVVEGAIASDAPVAHRPPVDTVDADRAARRREARRLERPEVRAGHAPGPQDLIAAHRQRRRVGLAEAQVGEGAKAGAHERLYRPDAARRLGQGG